MCVLNNGKYPRFALHEFSRSEPHSTEIMVGGESSSVVLFDIVKVAIIITLILFKQMILYFSHTDFY